MITRIRRAGLILGLAGAVCLASAGARAEEVEVREGVLSLPIHDARPMRDLDPAHPRSMDRVHGTEHDGGVREWRTVILENRFVRIEVVPELGGVIASTVFKPTGDDFFFREGKTKTWTPYWESGVKVSFPFREHGIALEDQPAAYRVVRGKDGSATVATWMEFSRFAGPSERWIYGRASDMLLSQRITLRPGEATFTATFRLTNPAPWKQGRRLWSDVMWPRAHTAAGAVQGDQAPPEPVETEWVFPARYVSSHSGKEARPYAETDTPLARYDHTMSIFAWDLRYGFAGLYYPEPRVARLVLFDPEVTPGAKQWCGGGPFHGGNFWSYKHNLVEFWNGSDTVFQAVRRWLGPGRAWQFTQRYVFATGLGKPDFANEAVVVNVAFKGSGRGVEAVPLAPVAKLSATLDGEPCGQAREAGPATPAWFPLPEDAVAGRLVLEADGRTILDQRFPLPIPEDEAARERIRVGLEMTPEALERNGANAHYGETFRSAVAKYPRGSLGRGRTLLRDGYLEAAIRDLQAAASADPADGEARYLLGVAQLETGDRDGARMALEAAVDAARPAPAAGRFLAILAMKRGDRDAAVEALEALLAREPENWEGRLMWIALTGDAHAARLAEREDPADPRLVHAAILALKRSGEPAGQAEATLKTLLAAEPGAARRLEEFKAALAGRYLPARRLGY